MQGVGYRRFAQKRASALQIAGWARNRIDGRVEVVAQGEEAILDAYCEELRKGPVFSQVHDVIVRALTEEQITQEMLTSSFEIKPDMEMER